MATSAATVGATNGARPFKPAPWQKKMHVTLKKCVQCWSDTSKGSVGYWSMRCEDCNDFNYLMRMEKEQLARLLQESYKKRSIETGEKVFVQRWTD
jgi:hypothetical protein